MKKREEGGRPLHGDPFERGLALFNAGQFFECHEEWEIPWRHSDGADRLFYQGLIQAAVAILHAERGNLRGAASTYAKSRAKHESLPAVFRGIALDEFRKSLAVFFAEVRTDRPLPARPQIRRKP
jgi:predicted metal-dependent hydrolase